ncbi:hypothetical protein M8C21_030659 [Ambrosia artemisiifolia]|uniref:Uncharacterized protein n=1 Tax=Ambrosia artemisiifolia TaxID=4212 RepID=A0AAD5G7L9_AMBAR|nr:hypothetical protein M8C21_030659 [Ambrosia artemisiifolia]
MLISNSQSFSLKIVIHQNQLSIHRCSFLVTAPKSVIHLLSITAFRY